MLDSNRYQPPKTGNKDFDEYILDLHLKLFGEDFESNVVHDDTDGGTSGNPHSSSAGNANNSDITSLSALTGNIETPNSIQFSLSPTGELSEGGIRWNAEDKTLEIKTETDAILQIGQEVYLRGTNKTGITITSGQLVYIDGAQGNRPILALAKADTEDTSSKTIAMATHNIDDNKTGYFTTFGLVRGLDTSAYIAETQLYLSKDTAGAWTDVPPTSPDHLVFVGIVVTQNANEGAILVSIQNGFETTELHDVDETKPTITGQMLRWNEANKKYQLRMHTICHDPVGIEFGNTTQEYDVDGTTWVLAVAGGTLGGIPDETSGGHALADCLTAIDTARDSSYLAVREGTGVASPTNPLTVQFLFTGITNFDHLDMRMQYTGGAGHTLAIEFWNYTTSTFDRLALFSDMSFYRDWAMKIHGAANLIGTGGDAGDVILQVIHTNTGSAAHHIEFDYVAICEAW
jgi:hypothetical protein